MKRFPVYFLLISLFIGSLVAAPGDMYKKESIPQVPTPGYGDNTHWATYLNGTQKIAAAGDGSLFILDSRGCRVSKFDGHGKFILAFGKEGNQPGELEFPGDITVLDDKYVVVADNRANQKISLFDLQGKFVKILKTQKWVEKCVALKDGKIALVSRDNLPQKSFRVVVSILDINGGTEKILAQELGKIKMLRKINLFLQDANLHVNAFIDRLPNGDLVLGFNNKNSLAIYSPAGKKRNTFPLNLDKIKVDDKIVQAYMDNYISTALKLKRRLPKPFIGRFQNSLGAIKTMFSDYLPLYGNLFVDGRGNILVFEYNNYRLKRFPGFRVYSARGRYLATSAMDFGNFQPPLVGVLFEAFCFKGDNLFAVLEDKIIKVVLK